MDDDHERIYSDLRELIQLDLCAGISFADLTADPYRLPTVVDGPVDIPQTTNTQTATHLSASNSEDIPQPTSLEAIAEDIRQSSHCALAANCTNPVPGEGNIAARMVFVGDALTKTMTSLADPLPVLPDNC